MPLVRIERQGLDVKVLTLDTAGRVPLTIAGRNAFSTDGSTLYKTDLDTGMETVYPSPLPGSQQAIPLAVSPHGTRAAYRTGTGALWRNLTNGLVRKHVFAGGFYDVTFDRDARYAWALVPGGKVRRVDLASGADTLYPIPTGSTGASLYGASNRFLFFGNESPLAGGKVSLRGDHRPPGLRGQRRLYRDRVGRGPGLGGGRKPEHAVFRHEATGRHLLAHFPATPEATYPYRVVLQDEVGNEVTTPTYTFSL